MSTIKSFEELIIWQEARKFANNIYNLTKKYPQEEIYSLTSQMRRASVSEVQNDLYISLDLDYINNEDFKIYYNHAQKIAKLINGLITYLKSQTESYSKTTKINEQIQQYL